MKVFKMINSRIEDGFILREAGTTYGVNKTTPISQTFNQASTSQDLPAIEVTTENKA